MKIAKPILGIYDTKPYDRDYLTRATGAGELDLHFHEFRLEAETALLAHSAQAVCVFVNDVVNREVLEHLQGAGVRLVALRCAGFNNVDLKAAKELGIAVTPETDRIVNTETLAVMKSGVMLVNVSRGRLIHTKSLIKALKSGHIGGVALDVYEEEEGIFFEDLSGEVLHDDELARLLTFPNVLVTAHQAFLTHEALSEIARVTVENVRHFASKQAFLEETVLC